MSYDKELFRAYAMPVGFGISLERQSFIHLTTVFWASRTSLVAQKVKNLPAIQETQVQFLGSGKSPGEGNDYPLEFSCLENSMNRGAWQAPVHEVAKSWTRLTHIYIHMLVDAGITLVNRTDKASVFTSKWLKQLQTSKSIHEITD